MKSIDYSRDGRFFSPAEVLISTREPYIKNALWIHPHDNIIEIKIFNKGWEVLFSSKDIGLSSLSLELVNEIVKDNYDDIIERILKLSNKISFNSITFLRQLDELRDRVTKLENKIN